MEMPKLETVVKEVVKIKSTAPSQETVNKEEKPQESQLTKENEEESASEIPVQADKGEDTEQNSRVSS